MYSLGVSSSSLSHGGYPNSHHPVSIGILQVDMAPGDLEEWQQKWLRGSDGQAALCVKYGINNKCHEFQFFVGKAQ